MHKSSHILILKYFWLYTIVPQPTIEFSHSSILDRHISIVACKNKLHIINTSYTNTKCTSANTSSTSIWNSKSLSVSLLTSKISHQRFSRSWGMSTTVALVLPHLRLTLPIFFHNKNILSILYVLATQKIIFCTSSSFDLVNGSFISFF